MSDALDDARAALARYDDPNADAWGYQECNRQRHLLATALRTLIAEHERLTAAVAKYDIRNTVEPHSTETPEQLRAEVVVAHRIGFWHITDPFDSDVTAEMIQEADAELEAYVQHRLTCPPADDEREAQRGTPEDPHDSLARLIWETSRDDEGTISATGANIVARAVLAAGFRRRGPITDEWEYGVGWRAAWCSDILGFRMADEEAAKAHAEFCNTNPAEEEDPVEHFVVRRLRERSAGPWEPVEAARGAS